MYTCVCVHLFVPTHVRKINLKWLEFEKRTLSSAGEDVEQLERPHPVGGMGAGAAPLGNSLAASYKVHSYHATRCSQSASTSITQEE